MARVLGRIRLSKDANEAGTSVERQRESIEQWSAMHGHEIIGWAVDSGVSGSVSPFETPELGPWLDPHKLTEWDVIVAYRLDRLSRRVIPLNELFGFVQKHGKTLASVSESLDLSTWIGRLVANVIAGVAEGELEAIRERNTGSQKKVRELGRWHGGTPPYGYRTEKRDDGWYLVPDEEERRVVREVMMPRVLAYESGRSIARLLNEQSIPTRTGTAWTAVALTGILRGKSILGQHTHKGKVVRDDNGLPQQRAEALLTQTEYDRVQEALSSRSVRVSAKQFNPLAGIVFCWYCDAPMYLQTDNSKPYSYYRCANRQKGCKARNVLADELLHLVEEHVTFHLGNEERGERIWVAGSDHEEELAAVREAIDSTRREKDMGLYDGDEESYFSRLKSLTTRRKELEALPSNPAHWEWVGIGETYGQAWQRMSMQERREMLLQGKIQYKVGRGVGKQFFFEHTPLTQKSPQSH